MHLGRQVNHVATRPPNTGAREVPRETMLSRAAMMVKRSPLSG